MNILNRRMFAEGDVATTQSTPGQMIDIPNLINYYVSQGYNSIDIKEMLPEVPMAVIESAVNALGGSVNPAIASPGADEFSGNINPFVEMQETTTLANQQGDTTINPSFPIGAASPELPSEDDISMIPEDIRRYMQATAQIFDDEAMVQGLKINFDLSEEEARRMVGMAPKPSTDISMIEPSLEKVSLTSQEDGLPDVAGVGADTGLGPNEYRTSNGKIYNIDPIKFKELLSGESSRIISGVLQNPNVEYGQALADIIETEALGRSSTLVDPNKIRVGAQDIILNPESFGDETLKFAVDAAKEGVEGLFNRVKGLGSSKMVGIFRGREAAKRAKEAGRDEYMNIFDTPLSSQTSIADSLAEISEYGNTGGEKPSTLDNIVLEASTGQVEKDLEEIAKEEAKPIEEKDGVVTTEETSTKDGDATGTSADPVKAAEPGDDKKEEDEKDADLPPGMTVATENDQAGQLFKTLGNAFNSDANLRMMRNVGKALTQYGNIAEGIGVGSAAASEERQLQEQLDAKREAELAAAGGIDITDRKKILDVQTEMNKSVRDYNNALAAESLANEVLKFANSNEDLTSFASKIGATVDDLFVAAKIKKGTDVKTLSDTKRAQIALDILTNANIKEILGESGRTISNIDRDIAERIAGNLNMKTLQSVAELKFRLGQNLKNITSKKNEAQRNIKSSVRFLAPYDPESIDPEILKIYLEELGQQMPSGYSSKSSSSSPEPGGIFIDDSK
jgi:hypothetical protein